MDDITVSPRQEADVRLEARMVRITARSLFQRMRNSFKAFPDNYLVFDVETTGIKPGLDLIGQLGYVKVEGRKPVDHGQIYLDWTTHPEVDQSWLRERIEATRLHVEFKRGQPTGRNYKVRYEWLQAGMEPIAALGCYRKLFQQAHDDGYFFVAHNGYHFDVRFIEEHFSTFLKDPFTFGPNSLYDTGMVEKGAQAGLTVWAEETVKDFSIRVSKQWLKGVKWALDSHCVPKYGLDKKLNIKTAASHDAAVDCLLTHLLFEEHRQEAERTMA